MAKFASRLEMVDLARMTVGFRARHCIAPQNFLTTDISWTVVAFCFVSDDSREANDVSGSPERAANRIKLSDLATNQIIYALTLLGVLLAANTILSHYGQFGFTFSERRWIFVPEFTWHVHASFFLYAMEGLLAISVYLYGFDFILNVHFFHSLGTWFFALALLTPPYFLLYLGYSNLFDLIYRIKEFWYYPIAVTMELLFLVAVFSALIFAVVRLESND
jgi:hypothetical protein